jgi:hypothetical protein
VLEMCLHAIPMILAEVGGLRDTFNEAAALFVKHSADPKETAVAFSKALDLVTALAPSELIAMLQAAHDQVLARHAAESHTRGVASLLGVA